MPRILNTNFLIPIALMLLMLGCSNDKPEEAVVADTSTPDPTATRIPNPLLPRPTPEPTPPTYDFSVTPDHGPCDQQVQLSATGMPPGTNVEFIRRQQVFDPIVLGMTRADTSGNVSFTISANQINDCEPGSWLRVEMKVVGTTLGPEVIFKADQLGPLTVSPSPVRCDRDMTISGSGFPPGSEVILLLGQPFGDNYVGLGTASADGSGRISIVRTAMGIPQQEQMILGRVQGVSASWRATYRCVP